MKIITGYTGTTHVTSDDDRSLHAGTFGKGSYVLNVHENFEAEIISANKIKIKSGSAIHQGTHCEIGYGMSDDLDIETGTTGYKRRDLIVIRYTKNIDVESAELVVIKGTPSYSDPVLPSYIQGDILSGATKSDMPLYSVELDGVNLFRVMPLFKLINKGLDDVYKKDDVYNKNEVYKKDEVYSKSNFCTQNIDIDVDLVSGRGMNGFYLPEGFTKSNTFFLGYRRANGSYKEVYGDNLNIALNEETVSGKTLTSVEVVYSQEPIEGSQEHKIINITLLFMRT